MAELTIHIEEPIEYKIQEFKEDREKMLQINEFLDDVFEKAKLEAENRLRQKQKGKLVRTLIDINPIRFINLVLLFSYKYIYLFFSF